MKCTIAVDHTFEDHYERFRPDATLLFLRNPSRSYLSLQSHWWRDQGGPIDDKFRLLEEHFRTRSKFTVVVNYEDFLARRPEILTRVAELWPIKASYFDFPRNPEDVARSCLPIAAPASGGASATCTAAASVPRRASRRRTTRRTGASRCCVLRLYAQYQARHEGR